MDPQLKCHCQHLLIRPSLDMRGQSETPEILLRRLSEGGKVTLDCASGTQKNSMKFCGFGVSEFFNSIAWKADVPIWSISRNIGSANGRGWVKRGLILVSLGQRTTLAMNRQRFKSSGPTSVTYQLKFRSYLPPALVILRFDPASARSGHSPYELTSVPLVRVKPAFPITRKKRAVKSTTT